MNQRKIGILLSYFNIIINTVINFAYVPLLLHFIGKSEYGLFQLIGSFIAYFSVMDFGLTAAVIRFYTKYKALQDIVKMENILAVALRGYAIITVILFLVGCVFYMFIPDMFAKSMSESEIVSAQKLFILLLFNMVITVSTMIFRAVINAHERFVFLKGIDALQLILQPVLVIVVLQELPSALAVAAVQTVLNVCVTLARIYYCFQKLRITIRYHYLDDELFCDFKKLALSIFAVAIIDQVFFKTNQVILGIVGGTAAVAVYSIASLIYMNYMVISTAISGVYLPHITEMVAKNEPIKNLSELFIKIGRLQYFLLALVSSGFIIFGRKFIYIWAGEDFDDAYIITLLIIIPFTIDLIQNIGLAILQAQNTYDFRAKVYFAMGVFNLVLAFPLASMYGGIGCAFATGLAMLIGNGLIMNWYYMKVTGLEIVRFWREIYRITLPILPLVILAYLGYGVLGNSSKMRLLLGISAYTIMYIIIIYCFSMNDKETNIVKNIKCKLHL